MEEVKKVATEVFVTAKRILSLLVSKITCRFTLTVVNLLFMVSDSQLIRFMMQIPDQYQRFHASTNINEWTAMSILRQLCENTLNLSEHTTSIYIIIRQRILYDVRKRGQLIRFASMEAYPKNTLLLLLTEVKFKYNFIKQMFNYYLKYHIHVFSTWLLVYRCNTLKH